LEFNDVRLQYEQLKTEIDAAVTRVLSSGWYILGKAVQTFEEEFARYCGVSFGIGLASGTDALKIGLAALNIRPGDEVLVPAVSAPATAMAVALRAKPVFVDIRSDDFNMDAGDAFRKMSPRTRAMIPVHLYGMPARMADLSKLGIPIIEDAAQAHGSAAQWGKCGSSGIAAAFSFYPTKNLGTYGDGGMLLTSNPEIAERARMLRNYGQRTNYISEMLGENSRLDEVHAAILSVKLKRLDAWNDRRREIAAIYRQELSGLPVGMQAESGQSNYHLFAVTTPQRDALQRHLSTHEIPSLVHYPVPLSRQKAFVEFEPAECRNADRLCAEVLSLPIHGSMRNSEVDQVIDSVRKFFSR
jgi:dTDP-4-amino-4,6-dideoxygalactose transaminase